MNNANLMRKIHIYVGLFFFLQVFLFTVSGFMLNHRWKPWTNWEERIETQNEIHVHIPVRGTNLEKANAVLESLGVVGEINGLYIEPENDLMTIRASRPGQYSEIRLSISTGNGTIKRTKVNAWSLLNNFHTFTGLHSNIPDKKNWIWTKVWSLIMDLTALALLTLLVTGFYMWTRLKQERKWGIITIGMGGTLLIVILWMIIKL